MVAYSFKAQFAEPIAGRIKLQTVRGPRKRHARPGESLQLYTGMRTKYCRKIVDPDPTCIALDHIWMRVDGRASELIEAITINGIDLGNEEIEAFAIADGFGSQLADGFARRRMGQFWIANHDVNAVGYDFEGFVIRWEHNA